MDDKKEILSEFNNQPDSYYEENKGIKEIIWTFIIFWVVTVILTYVLPDNVLDLLPPLRNLVVSLESVSPGVRNLGLYSKFPQVSQAIFSIALVSIPVLCILVYRAMRKDSRIIAFNYKAKNRKTLPRFVILIIFTVLPLFLPGKPLGSYKSELNDYVFYYRLYFPIYTTLAIFFVVGGTSLIISFLNPRNNE